MAQLASCSKIVATYDIDKKDLIISFQSNKGNINQVIWNHNSIKINFVNKVSDSVLASCGNDGKIVLSHSQKAQHLLTLQDDQNLTTPINSIKFTSNSQYLAAGCNDGKVKIFNLKKRNLDSTLSSHLGPILSVDWNNQDTIIASSSNLGDIVLYNPSSSMTIANFSCKTSQGIKMVKFQSFKANQLASAGNDGSVYVWDTVLRTTSASFPQCHNARVFAIAFSTCTPKLLCSASIDNKINFFDIDDKKVVKSLNTEQPLTSLVFYNDGHTIAVGTLYGQIFIYDLRKGASVMNILQGHDKNSGVNSLDFIKYIDLPNQSLSSIRSASQSKLLQPNQNQNNMHIDEICIQQNTLTDISNKNKLNFSPISDIKTRNLVNQSDSGI